MFFCLGLRACLKSHAEAKIAKFRAKIARSDISVYTYGYEL